MRYAVLGCGPAGMMAAHALARDGCDFDIISDRKTPSATGGAMYLHIAVPGLTEADPEGKLLVVKKGSEEGYVRKIGRANLRDLGSSWSKFQAGYIGIWNLQEAYSKLWACYHSLVREHKIDGYNVHSLYDTYEAVISTIPKVALCRDQLHHSFQVQRVWIRVGDDLGLLDDTMIYSGEFSDAWYRASNIFGNQSKEYPFEVPLARRVNKPLTNDCDCNPEICHLGRYGRWEKRWLTSDAYTGARDYVRAGRGVPQRTGQLPTAGQAQGPGVDPHHGVPQVSGSV